MNFVFLLLLGLVVVIAAVVLPLMCHTRQWRLPREYGVWRVVRLRSVGLGLKQIAVSKPATAANLPYRKKD
jgi:hypothetical protein